jgi:hypothetical protein
LPIGELVVVWMRRFWMQLLFLLVVILMNGTYLSVAFNMDSMLVDESAAEIPEIVPSSDTSTDFDLVDLLDLDIFDFDVEELADSKEHSESLSRAFFRRSDGAKR